jgi:hypothetical protein
MPQMKPDQLKANFDDIATRLFAVMQELERISTNLTSNVDQKATRRILTNLQWAIENCTVMGKHAIGELLEDKMGYGP